MTEQPSTSTTDDAEKDQYPPDSAFGRAAAEDQEKVDQLQDGGADASTVSDEPQREPRAASKAEPAGGTASSDEAVDEASDESFPASDPPSSSGSTA
jgi:hypothetical protein